MCYCCWIFGGFFVYKLDLVCLCFDKKERVYVVMYREKNWEMFVGYWCKMVVYFNCCVCCFFLVWYLWCVF